MGKFLLGVICTLVALAAAGYIYLEKGFAEIRADAKPGMLESWLGGAMDASASRHAPKATNPVPDSQATLLAAAQTYRTRCMVCHGGPNGGASKLGESFSPPAPQFFGSDPPDMPENENFYIIAHGVRMTAMPAWKNFMNDEQIWQTVTLFKHINAKTLPPEVAQELSSPQP